MIIAKVKITRIILLFLALISINWPRNELKAEISITSIKRYKQFQSDQSGLEKYPEIYNRYKEIQKSDRGGLVPRPLLAERIRILETVIQKEPDWVDGKWVLAANYIGLSSTLVQKEDEQQAISNIALAERYSRACLKQEPNHVLCKFFLAVALGQHAAIKGLLASLSNAKEIFDLFKSVYQSNYDYVFDRYGSVQASTRDAIGIFMKVVPDSSILEWLLGIRGNRKEAMRFHQETIELIGLNSCNSLYLATATLCYAEELDSSSEARGYQTRGKHLLRQSMSLESANAMLANCSHDSQRILSDLSLACGYTPMRQQQAISDEELKASTHQ